MTDTSHHLRRLLTSISNTSVIILLAFKAFSKPVIAVLRDWWGCEVQPSWDDPSYALLVLQKKAFVKTIFNKINALMDWLHCDSELFMKAWNAQPQAFLPNTNALNGKTVHGSQSAGSQLDRGWLLDRSGPPRKSISAEFWLKPTFSLPQQYRSKPWKWGTAHLFSDPCYCCFF